MSRVRLTQRNAAEDKTPYPGDVNVERTDPEGHADGARDTYDTFEQTVNYELPDMRHDWKNDTRNEIGFGIPTVASIRSAASKAVKLAVLLLGDKVAEDLIEAQARDFMKLGSKALNASLMRFASTQTLYAEGQEEDMDKMADDKMEDDKKASAVKADDKKMDEPKADDKKEMEASAKKACPTADDKKEVEAKKAGDVTSVPETLKTKESMDLDTDKKSIPETLKTKESTKAVELDTEKKDVPAGLETKEASAKKAGEVPDALKDHQFEKKSDDKKEDDKKASVVKAEDKKDEEPKATVKADDKKEDEMKADDKEDEMKASDDKEEEVKAGELDVEMTADEMDQPEASDEEDKELASIYAMDEEMDEPKADDKMEDEKKASTKTAAAPAKKGISKLGGQPRVASQPSIKDGGDISNIWQDAPDISGIW